MQRGRRTRAHAGIRIPSTRTLVSHKDGAPLPGRPRSPALLLRCAQTHHCYLLLPPLPEAEMRELRVARGEAGKRARGRRGRRVRGMGVSPFLTADFGAAKYLQ